MKNRVLLINNISITYVSSNVHEISRDCTVILNSILQYRIECHSSLESYDPIRSIGSHRAPPANQKHARHRRQSVWTVECFMQLSSMESAYFCRRYIGAVFEQYRCYAVYFSCDFCTLFFDTCHQPGCSLIGHLFYPSRVIFIQAARSLSNDRMDPLNSLQNAALWQAHHHVLQKNRIKMSSDFVYREKKNCNQEHAFEAV